jgi:hypothetical protein
MPVTIETAQALGDPTLVGEEVDEEPDVPQVAVPLLFTPRSGKGSSGSRSP